MWWFVSTNTTTKKYWYNLLGDTIILRWDHAFSYASVAIGSLVDLWYKIYIDIDILYNTIYCKWNVRLLNACGYTYWIDNVI